ncbi:MAG: hypothetical protein CFE27_14900 [Alphaproteobacteria bacterium PA1]|nr:MAG: hypothetical protein CFE27_14900 [Alphaproteobacteria bacterium PA1]
MTIQTAAQGPAPEFIELVEITWPSGIVRMLKGPGIVTALSQTWLSVDATWGQILGLTGRTERAGEISNRDLVLRTTASVRSQLWYGATRWSQVRIWEASRDPITGTADVAADPWIGFIDDANADDGIDGSVTLTLVSNAAILREPDAGALTSTTSQNRFVTGDTAFDFISGPVRDPFSLQGTNPTGGFNNGSSGGGGFTGGGMNDFDSFTFSQR